MSPDTEGYSPQIAEQIDHLLVERYNWHAAMRDGRPKDRDEAHAKFLIHLAKIVMHARQEQAEDIVAAIAANYQKENA